MFKFKRVQLSGGNRGPFAETP